MVEKIIYVIVFQYLEWSTGDKKEELIGKAFYEEKDAISFCNRKNDEDDEYPLPDQKYNYKQITIV